MHYHTILGAIEINNGTCGRHLETAWPKDAFFFKFLFIFFLPLKGMVLRCGNGP